MYKSIEYVRYFKNLAEFELFYKQICNEEKDYEVVLKSIQKQTKDVFRGRIKFVKRCV